MATSSKLLSPPVRRGPLLVVAGWLLVAGNLLPDDAAAFCRSTACKGSACDLDDDGCPATGAKLFWNRPCIGYSLQKNGTQLLPMEDVRKAVRKAFFNWSALNCGGGETASLTFGELADTPCNTTLFDPAGANVNVVIFKDDEWIYKGEDNTLAKAVLHYDAKTGQVLDADIEVNTASNFFTAGGGAVKFDLETVLTHEVGHFLGLSHSPDPESIMFASYEKGTKRKLSVDDIAAICAVYPPGSKQTCDLTPAGGFDTCTAPPDTTCSAMPVLRKAEAGSQLRTRELPPGQGAGNSSPTWLPLMLAVAALAAARFRRSKESA